MTTTTTTTAPLLLPVSPAQVNQVLQVPRLGQDFPGARSSPPDGSGVFDLSEAKAARLCDPLDARRGASCWRGGPRESGRRRPWRGIRGDRGGSALVPGVAHGTSHPDDIGEIKCGCLHVFSKRSKGERRSASRRGAKWGGKCTFWCLDLGALEGAEIWRTTASGRSTGVRGALGDQRAGLKCF